MEIKIKISICEFNSVGRDIAYYCSRIPHFSTIKLCELYPL